MFNRIIEVPYWGSYIIQYKANFTFQGKKNFKIKKELSDSENSFYK